MASDGVSRVLSRIEEEAERYGLPIIGRRKAKVLARLIRRFKPRRVLEVGTLVGYSAIVIASELGEGGEVVTVERDRVRARIAERNIEEAGLKSRVKVVVGDALEEIPRIEGFFDMMFIDASKSEYLSYLKLAEGKLRRGAVVVADNVGGGFSRLLRDYLDYVRGSGRYVSWTIPVGWDAFEVSVKL